LKKKGGSRFETKKKEHNTKNKEKRVQTHASQNKDTKHLKDFDAPESPNDTGRSNALEEIKGRRIRRSRGRRVSGDSGGIESTSTARRKEAKEEEEGGEGGGRREKRNKKKKTTS
jgi:hypothetical protein